MDAGDISPLMVLVSPTKRCGKTSVLIVLYFLTPRSELSSNITAPALFRAADNFDKLAEPDPKMPDLNDRAADNWHPLLAIADLAGGTWPEH